jgi:benzil reductase ((S)-benzoin forming)
MRNIFITGVSSGIGLELARYYLELGDQVYGVSRRSPVEFKEKYKNFFFKSVDLSQLESIDSALKNFIEPTKAIDLVILNAGILGELGDLSEILLTDLKRTMDVNLWSNKVILDRLFYDHLQIKQVVFISTGAAIKHRRGWAGYSLSKAAMNMMAGLYAAEKPNTHFMAMAPGIVNTPMQKEYSDFVETVDLIKHPSFSDLARLRQSAKMLTPSQVVPTLVATMENYRNYPSGGYVQARESLETLKIRIPPEAGNLELEQRNIPRALGIHIGRVLASIPAKLRSIFIGA